MKQQLLTVLAALCINCAIAQPTVGLVAYWPMNGNFTDAGPNGINCTNIGATATTNNTGAANTAMAFVNPSSSSANMVNQYATHPINSLLNFGAGASFTLNFNVYFNSPFVGNGGIYDNNLNGFGYGAFFWQAPGFPQMVFNWRNSSVLTTNGAIPLATWRNICCVVTTTSTSIYINGVLNATNTTIGTSIPSYPLAGRFGSMSYSGYPAPNNYNGFNGKIDEMRIYNRALTTTEITQLASIASGGALPIKLSNFTAAKNSADVLLQWQTEYEQNSDYYTIQQSTDGFNFTNIGKVQAKGNSSLLSTYQFTDNSISTLTNAKALYYRLVSADKDGRTQNSNIISVRMDAGKPDGLVVLQNPVSDQLNLQLSSFVKENGTIIITDVSGRQLISKSVPLHTGNVYTAIPVNMLAAGNYYITLINSSGKQTKSFIRPSL